MTAPLDREEREMYRLVLVCVVQTEETLSKHFVPLLVSIYDEDDNAPYVNGTNTDEIMIEFNRNEVSLYTARRNV